MQNHGLSLGETLRVDHADKLRLERAEIQMLDLKLSSIRKDQ